MIIYKKLLVFLFFYMISLQYLHAQTANKKDSLMSVIKKAKPDTNKVWAIFDYGRIMSDEHVDSAAIYYEKGLALSKKLNFKKGISSYYVNIIYLVGYRNKNKAEGLKIAKEYEKFALKEKNQRFLAKAYFSTGVAYQGLDISDSAIIFYEKSLTILEKIKDLSELPVIYTNLSSIYIDQKLYDIGLKYGKKALEADTKNKDTLGIIADHVNLSIIYFEKKDFKNEELHNRASLKLSEKINSSYRIMVASTNMADMFLDRNNLDSSLYYNHRAYQYAVKYGAKEIKIERLLDLANVYSKRKDYKNAYKYLQLATGESAINELILEKQLYLTQLKIDIYKNTGRYKEAAFLLSEFNKLTDSSFVIATQERVLEFDNKLKKAESEKVILAKEVKIQEQKTWIYVLGILGGSLFLLGFLYYRYQNKKQIAKNQTIKLLEQENEFVAVKSALEGQLNERVRISKEIHDDLGSSLTSISLLTEVLKNKIDSQKVPEVNKISAASAQMVDSLNEIVWSLNNQNDTLNSLVAFIRKYARDFLQDTSVKLTFNENVNQDFTLQGNVRRSIYLVVKEAINNVVKHADAHVVKLNIEVENNKLIILIEDDGKGLNSENKTVFGNGLRNMKQRMEEIGGTFEMYHTKGTVVSIEYNFSIT
jgi:signal transduction histidine kinase